MGRITSGEAVQKNTPLMIYRELKAEILDLTLPPGAVISENSICERFSVSRTPVRSAFQRLSDTRFIKIIPYKEITVTLLNLSQIKQMIFMRLAIESMIIRNFIDTMDPFVIEKMRYFMRTQTLLLKTNFTPRDFFDNDSGFHRIWYRHMGMDFLWRKIQLAQVHYTRFRILDYNENKKAIFKQLEKEHEELFNIIVKKDKKAVEPFMSRHLNGGFIRLGNRIYTDLARYFEDENSDSPSR